MEAKIISLNQAQQDGQPKTFIEVFKEFNSLDAVDNLHSEDTIYKYQNFANNFENYLKSTGAEGIGAGEMSIPIIKYFVLWLRENLKSCNKTHISKHIYRINKAGDHAVCMGYTPYNPTAAFKVKRGKNKEVVNLDDEQFLTWVGHKWHLPIYTQAQDYFIFQMSAGLSYMDLFGYKTKTDKYGLWIECPRGKTNKNYYVPLWHEEFKIALDLHNKYNGKFPYIENHFYNRLIREMAAQLGIEQYITTHVGRKTFATLKDENGWELGPISALMGNTERVCREHYINPSKKKIVRELMNRGA